MTKGLLFAISACLVWGLIFVIPQYLNDFSEVEVVLGRYGSYGVVSALLFFRSGFSRVKRYPMRIWGIACIFALLSNLVYYFGLVAGLRFATPTLSVLIVGLAPIVIALYGNWHTREIAYRDLVAPCLLIVLGLIFVNATEVDWSFTAKSVGEYLFGLGGVVIALLSWGWYAVHNARFLKENPGVSPSEWSTLIGMTTFLWFLFFGALFAIGNTGQFTITKFFSFSPDILRYFVGATILGVVCSWLGCFLWGKASLFLPISLMGPLVMFETLFGLLFVFLFEGQIPSWIELLGAASMLSGVLLCVQAFRKKRLVGLVKQHHDT